jgi:2-methylcitrate dehydratase PrpD
VVDLGEHFLLDDGVTAKEFSCCAWAHPVLEAVRRLRDAHELAPERIVRIVVETCEEACRLVVRAPATTEEAQFSVAWPVAAMLVDGEVGPRQVLEERLGDAVLRRLAARVELVPSPEFTRLHGLVEDHDPEGADLAVVTVEFVDGSTVSSGRVDYPLPRFTRERIEAKFRGLTQGLLTPEAADELVTLVLDLDGLDDVGTLTRLIHGGWAEGG